MWEKMNGTELDGMEQDWMIMGFENTAYYRSWMRFINIVPNELEWYLPFTIQDCSNFLDEIKLIW